MHKKKECARKIYYMKTAASILIMLVRRIFFGISRKLVRNVIFFESGSTFFLEQKKSLKKLTFMDVKNILKSRIFKTDKNIVPFETETIFHKFSNSIQTYKKISSKNVSKRSRYFVKCYTILHLQNYFRYLSSVGKLTPINSQ